MYSWPMLKRVNLRSHPCVPRAGTSASPQSDVSSVLTALRLSKNEPILGHAWMQVLCGESKLVTAEISKLQMPWLFSVSVFPFTKLP
jgi:hypothetical protein